MNFTTPVHRAVRVCPARIKKTHFYPGGWYEDFEDFCLERFVVTVPIMHPGPAFSAWRAEHLADVALLNHRIEEHGK